MSGFIAIQRISRLLQQPTPIFNWPCEEPLLPINTRKPVAGVRMLHNSMSKPRAPWTRCILPHFANLFTRLHENAENGRMIDIRWLNVVPVGRAQRDYHERLHRGLATTPLEPTAAPRIASQGQDKQQVHSFICIGTTREDDISGSSNDTLTTSLVVFTSLKRGRLMYA